MEKEFSNLAKNKGKLTNLFILARPWNGMLIALVSYLGILTTNHPITLIEIVITFIAFQLLYMAGTTVNDIIDYKIDSVNMAYRPLQSHKLSQKSAKSFAVILYALGIVLAVNSQFLFAGIIAFFALTIIYSMKPFCFEKRGILGNLTLSIVTIFIPFYTGIAVALNSFFIPINLLILTSSFTALFLGVTILKDFKDIKGDKQFGKKTFVLAVGGKNAARIAILVIISMFITTTVLFQKLVMSSGFTYLTIAHFLLLVLVLRILKTDINNADATYKMFRDVRLVMFGYILLAVLFLNIKVG